jgi:hypothetical protein
MLGKRCGTHHAVRRIDSSTAAGGCCFVSASAPRRLGLAHDVPHGKQRVGRLFRRCWPEHGEHEPGDTARVCALYLAAPGSTGKFGTFHLALADPAARSAEFRFSAPRIFVGIDVYNGGQDEATITVRSPEQREQIITLHAGELRRIRTGWTETSSRVEFEFRNAAPLHFDNLAYAQP